MTDPVVTWPDWATAPSPALSRSMPRPGEAGLAGISVFTAPTTGTTLVLHHADVMGPDCVADVYWMQVRLTPLDALPMP